MSKRCFNPENLVLQLNEKAINFDISKYEDFIIALCGEREYQMNAIRNTIKFYSSSDYKNISELIEENFENNNYLTELYGNFDDIEDSVDLKDKLCCTIDLATGTGKTWVMYGVAQILLAEGLVDRVLVLTPSLTVKREVTRKFKLFSCDNHLKECLPIESKNRNPRIIDSSSTIKIGDICIDNIHKTYSHVSSSIDYSLEGDGERILVINDEAHHLLNQTSQINRINKDNMLEWTKFLENTNFNFKFILNVTGTPYKGNNYFKNVIFRYSITEGINDRYIKKIDYLEKDESKNWDEKLLAIYNNHMKNKIDYSLAQKHISIFITDRINKTNDIAKEIRNFLIQKENISNEEAEKLVIPVTSDANHAKYVKQLETIDEPENPVEWIVSVSMLTEGWDVDNIYQIIPHEERAFNSRLLISQVLGRGLRIPPEYRDKNSKHPEVVIFNHDSWSDNIDDLVLHVAEISKTITSRVLEVRKEYEIVLDVIEREKNIGKKKTVPSKAKISLPKSLGFKSDSTIREQQYKSSKIRKTDVSELYKTYSVKETVDELHTTLLLTDITSKTNFTKEITKEYLESLITTELTKIGEETVSDDNLQRAKQSFNVLHRSKTGFRPVINMTYDKPQKITTSEMKTESVNIRTIKSHNSAIMYSEESLNASNKEELENIETARNELQENNLIVDDKLYKTQTNITLLSSSNEIDFANRLVREEYAKHLDCWIKSRDRGFYHIPYIYRPGTHSMQKEFNPDFIIKQDNVILVVEIKSDYDTTYMNQVKLIGADSYFESLNKKVKDIQYYFYFLSPVDYTDFFENVIKNKKYNKRYDLHTRLLQKIDLLEE